MDSSWTDILGPLAMSVRVAAISTLLCLAVGTPLAYWLARERRMRAMPIEIAILLPLVLPPSVVGYWIIVVCGRRGWLGPWLEAIGLPLIFTWQGAVLAAAIVALPLTVIAARTAFEECDPELEEQAALEGCSRWRTAAHIILPVTARGLLGAALLCFGRALGEFGATLMVAGNIPDKTQTLPMLVYTATHVGDWSDARAAVTVLVAAAAALVLGYRLLLVRSYGPRGR